MTKMRKDAERRHEEILQIVEEITPEQDGFSKSILVCVWFCPQRVTEFSFSEGEKLAEKVCFRLVHFSSNCNAWLKLCSSTSSLSMLPGSPKIFHGRENELNNVVANLLSGTAAQIAILGTAGVGKSSLALAALHHPDIITKYGPNRHFVSCESAASATELISAIATYYALGQPSRPSKAIIKYLSNLSVPSVIVLDNFETPWEPLECRSEVEDFLSLLVDVKDLNLIVSSCLPLCYVFSDAPRSLCAVQKDPESCLGRGLSFPLCNHSAMLMPGKRLLTSPTTSMIQT